MIFNKRSHSRQVTSSSFAGIFGFLVFIRASDLSPMSMSLRPTILALVLGFVCGICLWKPISWIEGSVPRRSTRIPDSAVLEKMAAVPLSLPCTANSTLRLVFAVMSTPNAKGATKRSMIRGSWPRKDIYKFIPSSVHITAKFVMGTKDLPTDQLRKLKAEQDKFNDLLLLTNHRDVYDQLAEKVRKTIQWVDKNLQFDYFTKTDDDVVFRLDNMVDALRKMGCPKYLYWGYLRLEEPVIRAKNSKYNEAKWNSCSLYLPYYSGTGYTLGRGVVRLLMRYLEHLIQFSCEDVTMGFWLTPYHLTRKTDQEHFHMHATCSDEAIQSHHEGNLKSLKSSLQAMVEKKGQLC